VGEPSDGELLRFARDGDPAAFRILIRRHDRHLYRMARSVLLDDQEAEDVVQETYILAFTRLVARFFNERNAPNRKISVPSLPLRLRSA